MSRGRACTKGACRALWANSDTASESGWIINYERRMRARRVVGAPVGAALPPLPKTTPHSLRRTYISIALLANRFDVKWVMSRVGHADSKMTLDVYAQLEQRVKREHGVRFDALVRSAEAQLRGAGADLDWETSGRRNADSTPITARDYRPEAENSA